MTEASLKLARLLADAYERIEKLEAEVEALHGAAASVSPSIEVEATGLPGTSPSFFEQLQRQYDEEYRAPFPPYASPIGYPWTDFSLTYRVNL